MADQAITLPEDSRSRKIPTSVKSSTFAQDLMRTLSITIAQIEQLERSIDVEGDDAVTLEDVERIVTRAKKDRPNPGDVFKLDRDPTHISRGGSTSSVELSPLSWDEIEDRPRIPDDIQVHWENIINRPTLGSAFDPSKYYTRSTLNNLFDDVDQDIRDLGQALTTDISDLSQDFQDHIGRRNPHNTRDQDIPYTGELLDSETILEALETAGTVSTLSAILDQDNDAGGHAIDNAGVVATSGIHIPDKSGALYHLKAAENGDTGLMIQPAINPDSGANMFAVEPTGNSSRFGVTQGYGTWATDGFWIGQWDESGKGLLPASPETVTSRIRSDGVAFLESAHIQKDILSQATSDELIWKEYADNRYAQSAAFEGHTHPITDLEQSGAQTGDTIVWDGGWTTSPLEEGGMQQVYTSGDGLNGSGTSGDPLFVDETHIATRSYVDTNYIKNIASFDTDDLSEGAANRYSPWSEEGSDLYYNGGRVGVGTDLPEHHIHVSGGNLLVEETGVSANVILNRTDGKAVSLAAACPSYEKITRISQSSYGPGRSRNTSAGRSLSACENSN